MSEKRVLEDGSVTGDAKKPKVAQGIRETDVGITEYLCKRAANVRITGSLKQRYTDFLVNEIGPDGTVVHLTDVGLAIKEASKEEKAAAAQKEAEEAAKQEAKKEEFALSPEDDAELVELFGRENVDALVALMKDGQKKVEITDKVFDRKDQRTRIHQLVRRAFFNNIESVTTAANTFVFGTNINKHRKKRMNAADGKPADHNLGPRKNFLHFVAYKENKETMEVASIIAKLLRVPVKKIQYAGTKDRRGVTCQRMSIEGMPVERVTMLNKALRGCKLGCFSYADEGIKLGDLKGNEFIVTIKDAHSTDPNVSVEDALNPIMESLRTQGFINYFGMQRFGTFSNSTHQIGKQMLKWQWKAAGELILQEQEVCIPGSQEARKIWAETRDAGKALKKMPRKCNAEFSILSRLENVHKEEGAEYDDNDYFNAVMGIARNLRVMYVHSYQSYVWNVVASKRMDLFGTKVVAGDLVFLDNPKIHVAPSGPVVNEDGIVEDVKTKHVGVRAVTEEEAASGLFDIHDIVLPTPGYDVQYPSNETLKQLYVDTMAKDDLDPFDMTRRVKEFSLAGAYRHVVAKVQNLECYVRHYNDVSEELVRTDLIMHYMNAKAKEGSAPVAQILEGTPEGTKTAVILKMQLGTSTYATMALRELLEGDTSRYGGVVTLHDPNGPTGPGKASETVTA